MTNISQTLITNGNLYLPTEEFTLGSLLIENEQIKAVAFSQEETRTLQGTTTKVIDAQGMYIIPGLIDLHFHGCMGKDFCDGTPESLHNIAKAQLNWGVTGICPASMTLSEDKLKEIFENAASFQAAKDEAELLGINMEGPFLAEAKLGAQNPTYLQKPNQELFARLQDCAQGLIKLVSLAPELEGAVEFIKTNKNKVRISLAHSNASYMQADRALKVGASQVTHLFNAMTPFSHREPGILGAALDNEATMVELICDGVHLHPATVRLAFKLFGADRIILISDSMEACGLKDGNYQLGQQPVTVHGNLATITGTHTIAGSVTNLADCVRWSIQEAGLSISQAIKSATLNPAKALGLSKAYGSLEVGKFADLLLLDQQLNLKHIIKHGSLIK